MGFRGHPVPMENLDLKDLSLRLDLIQGSDYDAHSPGSRLSHSTYPSLRWPLPFSPSVLGYVECSEETESPVKVLLQRHQMHPNRLGSDPRVARRMLVKKAFGASVLASLMEIRNLENWLCRLLK